MKNKLILLSCSCLFLSGCIGHETGTTDLQKFVTHEKAKTPPPIQEVPIFPAISQFPYVGDERRDPFDSGVGEAPPSPTTDPTFTRTIPDEVRNHPREELEGFSLDSLSMQGTLVLKGVKWVLIKDPDGTLHRVKQGNYMGKNYGRIINISEEKIILAEYFQGQNGYEPRQSEIALENL